MFYICPKFLLCSNSLSWVLRWEKNPHPVSLTDLNDLKNTSWWTKFMMFPEPCFFLHIYQWNRSTVEHLIKVDPRLETWAVFISVGFYSTFFTSGLSFGIAQLTAQLRKQLTYYTHGLVRFFPQSDICILRNYLRHCADAEKTAEVIFAFHQASSTNNFFLNYAVKLLYLQEQISCYLHFHLCLLYFMWVFVIQA